MDSCLNSDVSRLRRRACRCAELRLRCRYFVAPPAIVVVQVLLVWLVWFGWCGGVVLVDWVGSVGGLLW